MLLNNILIMRMAGLITIVISLAMLPSLFVSFLYKEYETVNAFALTIVSLFILGLLTIALMKPKTHHLRIRDGYAIVSLCWILSSLLGAIPFMLTGDIPNFADAFFETSSGFSTTGASILTDIEALPKGLLFWRSFTHWLGGMGILVFAIAFLPTLGISGNRIAGAETTGPTLEKVSPKMTDTAKILYKIYLTFTVAQVLLLMLGDVNLYDSLIHTFGTVGTGGFSNYGDSVAHFSSTYVRVIITIFMILAGTNFALYHSFIRSGFKDFVIDSEFKAYLLILSIVTLLIAFNLAFTNHFENPSESLLDSAFQVASIMTTTGFATTDFDLWPTFSKILLFLLMFTGGCSSSTSGSMKVIRILVLFKMIKRGIIMRLHPQAVVSIKIDGKALPADTISAIGSFFFLFMGVQFLGTLLISLENFDFLTSFSAVAACLGNIGPGFSLVGPTLNFSIFSDASKLFLSLLMIAGRLELFTIMLLFTPQFWNQDK